MKYLLLALALAGCAAYYEPFHINPKPVPAGAILCSSDWACPLDMHCGFPEPNTYAQCLPGGGDIRWGGHGH